VHHTHADPGAQLNSPCVVQGTDQDATVILEWLQQEHAEDGEGFWSNRGIIENAALDGELYVIRRRGTPVAFQVGHHAPDIISVRKDYRRTGMGRALIEASIERAARDDITVLEVSLINRDALAFDCALGFEEFSDPYDPHTLHARFVLEREFELPHDGVRIPVTIAFGHERSRQGPVFQLSGVRDADDSIQLERRAIGVVQKTYLDDDLLVRIEVGGVQLYSGKAKYDEARALGVTRGNRGLAFYLDRIATPLG
jgi:GNAT superfamily N-acetyltransferase